MSKNSETHSVCNKHLKELGGKATCCECDEKKDCEIDAAQTPLGEALQTPCPRCNISWIRHDCPEPCDHNFEFGVFKSIFPTNLNTVTREDVIVICSFCGAVRQKVISYDPL